MKLCLINHSYKYELEKLIRIFLPFEKIEFSEEKEEGDRTALTSLLKGKTETELSAELIIDNNRFTAFNTLSNDSPDYDNECERLLAVALYNCFVSASGYVPEWGILTGVRPAKLFSRYCEEYGEDYAVSFFKNKFLVKPYKIDLCREAVKGEESIISLSEPKSFSLYLSVPFCPSRCSYCSFVSHSVEKAFDIIPQYVDFLCRELEHTAQIAKKLNLRLETVYMGGGTPTTLTAEQLNRVLGEVNRLFDMSTVREFTVEAGRPDTIDTDKLCAIKKNGVTRISINPQTMNDSVLRAIGRNHTASDTVNAFKTAREIGFDNINMDLIAGLPTDDFESFKNTLKKIIELMPESVTVHSLSVKRAATITSSGQFAQINSSAAASQMVSFAREVLTQNGILPYYMYRQSKTVGNLENVGYARQGFEGLYNVYIMDETHTILACGASAVTKLKDAEGKSIKRIFNFKYPYEYISKFDELINRKKEIGEFYGKHFK